MTRYGAPGMLGRVRLPRYRLAARWYDVLSLERLLYRRGRLVAIRAARLRPGARVLDLGCGTGLSFAPLRAGIGRSGQIVGVDASAAMLAGARRRLLRNGWSNVQLEQADAGEVTRVVRGPFDAVICCYSLSIVDHWQQVWRDMLDLVAPGGTIVVADTAYPTGWHRILAPLAWVLLVVGGVHPRRRVWTLVERDLEPTLIESLTGGHVHVAVGRKPGTTR